MKDVKISDYLWFQEGPGVRNTQYTTSGVKLINVANLVDGNVDLSTSDRYISEEEAYGKYNHFLADDGDFVIASSGIKIDYFDKKMGFIKKEHLPLCMNTSCIRFKVLDTNNLEIKYFMYYLKSNSFKKQLFNQITGSAQLNFGPSHLKKMTFPLIELKEQKRIIERLDKTQNIINETKSLLSKYDTLIKSRFIEMFGEPHNNTKYPYKTVGEFTTVTSGGTPDRKNNEYWKDGNIPWVKTTELQNNELTDVEEFITQKGLDESSAKMMPIGTLLIAMYGQGKTRGMTAYLGIEASTNQACACILPSEEINQKYLWYYFILSYDKLRDLAKGGNQPNLNGNMIKNFPVLMPPIEMQNQYVSFVQQIDKSKFEIWRYLKFSDIMKKIGFRLYD